MGRIICSSLECHSTAVVQSVVSKERYCIECGIKIARQGGPDSIKGLGNFKLPWEEARKLKCKHCGVEYTMFLVGLTGDCPKCRKNLGEEVLNGKD